jgi:ATP-dependent exoDNAse (exonuclease V) alpha subunit
VQAGGWLAALAEQQPELALRQVIRQNDAAERAALAALHDGDPQRYIAHKRGDIAVHRDEHAAAEALLEQWHAARAAYGAGAVVMIVRDNQTRDLLNHLARQRLQAQHQLAATGVLIGAREYALGDRVIARRNERLLQVDNGTLGTVVATDSGNLQVRTDSGETRTLENSYVAEHMEHAYALTAHGAQGATVTWAGVLGRPEEFTREWAYTALSRAREKTILHIVTGRPSEARDADAYDPLAARRGRDDSLQALRHAMHRTQGEPLAAQQLAQAPPLGHRLAGDAYLARQRELDRLALADLQSSLPAATKLRRVGHEQRLRPPPEHGIRLHL